MIWEEFFTFSVEQAQIGRQNYKNLKIEKNAVTSFLIFTAAQTKKLSFQQHVLKLCSPITFHWLALIQSVILLSQPEVLRHIGSKTCLFKRI